MMNHDESRHGSNKFQPLRSQVTLCFSDSKHFFGNILDDGRECREHHGLDCVEEALGLTSRGHGCRPGCLGFMQAEQQHPVSSPFLSLDDRACLQIGGTKVAGHIQKTQHEDF